MKMAGQRPAVPAFPERGEDLRRVLVAVTALARRQKRRVLEREEHAVPVFRRALHAIQIFRIPVCVVARPFRVVERDDPYGSRIGEGAEREVPREPLLREIVVPADDKTGHVQQLQNSGRDPGQQIGILRGGVVDQVRKFEHLATRRLSDDADAICKRDKIITLYLDYAERANNWDLVDLSAPKLLGHWILLPTRLGDGTDDYKRQVIDSLAQSDNLWKQRISIVCTWKTSQQGDPSWCLRYAEMHLHHPHDLMHKAVGWMLREMGKRVSMDLLRDFLRQHAHEMARTTLRYAIELMSEEECRQWLTGCGDKVCLSRV